MSGAMIERAERRGKELMATQLFLACSVEGEDEKER